eukprot:5508195-Amphidinium_carterae.1
MLETLLDIYHCVEHKERTTLVQHSVRHKKSLRPNFEFLLEAIQQSSSREMNLYSDMSKTTAFVAVYPDVCRCISRPRAKICTGDLHCAVTCKGDHWRFPKAIRNGKTH